MEDHFKVSSPLLDLTHSPGCRSLLTLLTVLGVLHFAYAAVRGGAFIVVLGEGQGTKSGARG